MPTKRWGLVQHPSKGFGGRRRPPKKFLKITGSGLEPRCGFGVGTPHQNKFLKHNGVRGAAPAAKEISNISGSRAEPPTKIKFSRMMGFRVKPPQKKRSGEKTPKRRGPGGAPQNHRVRCRAPPKDGVQYTATARSWGGVVTPPKKNL